jgi:hypothetical protein
MITNNSELKDFFDELRMTENNIFNIYLQLAVVADEYKQLPIATIIPTVYDAYELFCKHDDKAVRIINAIENAEWSKLIDSLDITKLLQMDIHQKLER